MFFIVLLFLLLFLYLIFICPNLARRKMMEPFFHTEFAHRGLFSDARAIPENSMKAFQEAVRQHVGIELDVHLTKDEKVVVFTMTRSQGCARLMPSSKKPLMKTCRNFT